MILEIIGAVTLIFFGAVGAFTLLILLLEGMESAGKK